MKLITKKTTWLLLLFFMITIAVLSPVIPAGGTVYQKDVSQKHDLAPEDIGVRVLLDRHAQILKEFQPRMDNNTLSKIIHANYNYAVENNVHPNDALVIMLIESGGNPKAVSPKGAAGLYGIMPILYPAEAAKHVLKPSVNAYYGLKFLGHLKSTYSHEGAIKRYLCGETSRTCIDGGNARVYYHRYQELHATYFN